MTKPPEHERRLRSAVRSTALREYVARREPDEVTDAMNRACDRVDSDPDGFLRAAAGRVLERIEW